MSVDLDLRSRLRELFEEELPSELATLRAFAGGETDDTATLQRAAHTLRGSARIVGVPDVPELCAQLEDLAEAGRIDCATRGAVATLVREVEEALQRWRRETP